MMRHLFVASVLFVTLAGGVYGHGRDSNTPLRRRKTLSFGPEHPHAIFKSNPNQIQTTGFTPLSSATDPYDVARLFVSDVLSLSSGSWKIRKDSYTDESTGITHIYVRQVVSGLEVVDGDMNINIKDGRVLSYGNSFYTGPSPTSFTSTATPECLRRPRDELCGRLHEVSFVRQTADEQVIMSNSAVPQKLAHIIESNCAHPEIRTSLSSDPTDFRLALLQFMAAATPNRELANDIATNPQRYMESMIILDESHFAPGSEAHALFKIDNVPDTVSPVEAHLAYIQMPNQSDDATELQLVWKFEVEMQDNWYESTVTAVPPHWIVSVVDWASDSSIPIPSDEVKATYNVFPWGTNDPESGSRSFQKENFDSLASPAGWQALPYERDPASRYIYPSVEEGFWRNTTTTWGNNVFAQENWEGANNFADNYRPAADRGKVFDFNYKPRETDREGAYEEAQSYINATVTQLFYTNNMIHDFYYRYGFNEVAGNFQQYNFGRGGEEGDAVIANAQDGSGYNNANFMTPPDGRNGRMRMYLWNTALPYRDGDMEAGIVIHEYSHGLSTRLTGGPANSGCLGWGESGGMGEGWGDFFATAIRSNRKYSDYAMGAWAANRVTGIRHFVYSVDDELNPSTYKTLDKPGYWGVHAIGEVWAEMLWVVLQKLIEKHDYSDDMFPPSAGPNGFVPRDHHFWRQDKELYVPRHGNTLMIQLVINAMKLQPCRPSFFDARDAIIEADRVLTDGENVCLLWKGFAERGLGVDARVEGRTPWGGGIRTDGHAVPLQCQEESDNDKL